MAKGTRLYRRTYAVRVEGRVVGIHTSAHARAELALAPALRPHAWRSVIWHADASPFRIEMKVGYAEVK